jgi:hypothetical protein
MDDPGQTLARRYWAAQAAFRTNPDKLTAQIYRQLADEFLGRNSRDRLWVEREIRDTDLIGS